MIFEVTPSQTVGPYFAIGLPFDAGPMIVPEGSPGSIRITGTVYDGRGETIPDHLIEFWQPDAEGRFADIYGYGEQSTRPDFRGFGRYGVEDGDGSYHMVTVKPGRVPAPNGTLQAPHIDVTLFARGMLNRVVTRLYFADEAQANAIDPVLATVPAARRETLLAEPTAEGYRFDIHLQGPGETVFFDI
jgi:protocatechuate 3,4-dioxygenase alpha subunit